MDNADLLMEAVRNSLEAGAGEILIRVDRRCGMADVTVSDDSDEPVITDAFFPGVSSKGAGRGMGLSKVKEASGGACGLEKDGCGSVLRFSVVRDASLDDLSTTIPALLNAFPHLTVDVMEDGTPFYTVDGKALEHDGIDVRTAGGMNRLKVLVEEKEKRSR